MKGAGHNSRGWRRHGVVGLSVALALALAACVSLDYNPGNSVQGRALKSALAYRGRQQAGPKDPTLPQMPVGTDTSDGEAIAAPYIACASLADCQAEARVLNAKIGWQSADFPIGYRVELQQLRQVATTGLEFDAHDLECHDQRARARAALQDAGGATDDLTAVLQQRPDDGDARLRRIRLELIQSRTPEALADANAVLAREPGNVEALLDRSAIRAQMADAEGALADANRAVELAPASVDALAWRGKLRVQRREQALALADFDRAVALNPRDSGLYAQRGNVYAAFDAPEQARADYRRACDLGDSYWCTMARQ
jgi:regulator of sirC expression with transglutaminase-like and TPR domain